MAESQQQIERAFVVSRFKAKQRRIISDRQRRERRARRIEWAWMLFAMVLVATLILTFNLQTP